MNRKLMFSKIIKNDQNKPWLIMIHGFTQNHKIFDQQVNEFAGKFNILLVDLRGHGGSDHLPGPYGIEEYTDDLERLIEHYGLYHFYCWGTHTGSAISLVYALRHPGQILGLILEGTVLPGVDMPRVSALIHRARKISAENGIEAAKKDWFEYADWFQTMRTYPVECRADLHQKIIEEFKGEPWVCQANPRGVTDVNQRLHDLNMPILMYNGEADLNDFLSVARHIKYLRDDIRFELIPNAGGFPCWENPKEVNKLVRSFFNEIC